MNRRARTYWLQKWWGRFRAGAAPVAAAWIFQAACTSTNASAGPDEIDGNAFESEATVEMGKGPSGPVLGHASLSFQRGQYAWDYSDLHCVGKYTYLDGSVDATTVVPCGTGGTIHGRYDPASGILTWAEGATYRKR